MPQRFSFSRLVSSQGVQRGTNPLSAAWSKQRNSSSSLSWKRSSRSKVYCVPRSEAMSLWLLPISAMTKLGSPAPLRLLPSCSPLFAVLATATIRPWLSSKGIAMIRVVSRPASSAGDVPSAALRHSAFMAAVTGRFRSISPHPAIQRRKSPSVRTPCRIPDSVTTKINRDWLAVILLRAERIVSSAKTTNCVKFRSI